MNKMNLDQEIEYLRAEARRANEDVRDLKEKMVRMTEKAESFAMLSDIFRSMVLLPVDPTVSVSEISEKIGLALMLHGIAAETLEGSLVSTSILKMFGEERDAMLHSFLRLRSNRDPQPGCECIVCKCEEGAKESVQMHGRPAPEVLPHDGVMMIRRNDSLTPDEEADVRHRTQVLSRLLNELVGPPTTRGGGELLAMLFELMAGGRRPPPRTPRAG